MIQKKVIACAVCGQHKHETIVEFMSVMAQEGASPIMMKKEKCLKCGRIRTMPA